MNKKISVGIAITLIALAAAATFVITYSFALDFFNSKIRMVSEKEELYNSLSDLDNYVRANYKGTIDENVLMDSILLGYIDGIDDSFARIYSAEEIALIQRENTGVKSGLGFDYEPEESGYIKITGVLENSSAEAAGLLTGDIITAVNNIDVIAYERGYDEAVALFTCEEGTRVKLHIKRTDEQGRSDFFSLDAVSETTEVASVYGRLIGENTGYVRITRFHDRTPSQFKRELDSLISSGALNFIFDLRGNAGYGSMESLQGTLDCIIGDSDVIKAVYRDKEEVVVKTTEAETIDLPMTVLINGATSQNAELFAFALRDECGAQTVGEASGGRGILQNSYKLSDGMTVRITAASLETKNSGDFNLTGLKPNFEVIAPPDFVLSPIAGGQRLDVDSDPQLIKAIEVVSTIE